MLGVSKNVAVGVMGQGSIKGRRRFLEIADGCGQRFEQLDLGAVVGAGGLVALTAEATSPW